MTSGIANRDGRVEDRAFAVVERRAMHRRRIGKGAAAADELGAVGLIRCGAERLAVNRHQVHHPGRVFLAERGRRVQRIACRSRTSCVCTNRLLNAGCAASAAGGASTTSA